MQIQINFNVYPRIPVPGFEQTACFAAIFQFNFRK
jgi:hypothetical protein